MMMIMNFYSSDEELVIREFFDQTVPTFPFKVYAPPFYTVNAENVMRIKALCCHLIDPYSYDGRIPREVDWFLSNLAIAEQTVLCPFEHEIMQSQGYISLMYIYDSSRCNFENTVALYTRQYMTIKGYIDNPEAEDYFCIFPVINTPRSVTQNQHEVTNLAYRHMELIKNADLHKVVTVAHNGKYLVFSLSEILSLSYFGFEINPPPEDPNKKRSVSHMDYDEYMNAVETLGLERIELPAFVFEAPTKC